MASLIDPAGSRHPQNLPLARSRTASRAPRAESHWGIAINLVRAQKYEYRLGRMLARRFQEIHRAKSIHLEIEQGNFSRFIVRRLHRAVTIKSKR